MTGLYNLLKIKMLTILFFWLFNEDHQKILAWTIRESRYSLVVWVVGYTPTIQLYIVAKGCD